jgi:hypothetical protein
MAMFSYASEFEAQRSGTRAASRLILRAPSTSSSRASCRATHQVTTIIVLVTIRNTNARAFQSNMAAAHVSDSCGKDEVFSRSPNTATNGLSGKNSSCNKKRRQHQFTRMKFTTGNWRGSLVSIERLDSYTYLKRVSTRV